jgi:mono/diheme cytochrome c family protein
MRIYMTAIALISLALPTTAADTSKMKMGSAAKGKIVYLRDGCQGCHGTVGQGGVGPKLGPDPMPLEGMIAFVRNTAEAMPAFSANVLSDEELSDIHAYLASVSQPPDVKRIPILNE